MKTAKSITLDENTWIELREEADQKGVSLSSLVEKRVHTPPSTKEEIIDINKINNIMIIYNNNMIMLMKNKRMLIEKRLREMGVEEDKLKRERTEMEQARIKEMEEIMNLLEEDIRQDFIDKFRRIFFEE